MFALLAATALASSPVLAPSAAVPPALPPVVSTPVAVAQPPVDAARLLLARTSAGVLFSDGSMARMLDRMLSTAPNGYAATMLDMTLGDMMTMMKPAMPGGGKNMPTDTPEMKMTLRQMASKGDPYFDQRLGAIHDAVVAEAARLGPKFEPQLRDGLATALARRFTSSQLTDMNGFFVTPTGHAFSEEMYLMWFDSAVLKSMMSAVPGLAAEIPASVQRVKAAVDRYPWPKKEVAPEATPKKTVPKKAPPRRKK